MANEVQPLFRPGASVTALATADVTGKRLVGVSATRDTTTGLVKVAHAVAESKPFGVASYDAKSGKPFTVLRGGIVPLISSGAITAGAQVQAATGGKVATLADGVSVGTALETVGGADLSVLVALDI